MGLVGVLVHLIGDAVNSTYAVLPYVFLNAQKVYLDIGVIIASLILWKLDSPNRFYADPTASLAISLIIFGSAIPMSRSEYNLPRVLFIFFPSS